MSFLLINGQAVPVRVGTEVEQFEEIGRRERAFSGSLLSSRRALKRMWQAETRVMETAEAVALRQMLLALGHNWSFEDDVFSGKGLGLKGFTLDGLRFPYFAADGAPSPFDAKWPKSSALSASAGLVNSSNIGDTDGDASNWTNTDAPVTATSTHAWTGAGSILATYSAVANSIRGQIVRIVSDFTLHTGVDLTLSVRIKMVSAGSGNGKVRVRLNELSGGSSVTTTPQLVLNEWVTIRNMFMVGAGTSVTIQLEIEEDTVDSGMVIAVDGVQFELSDFSSSWSDSGFVNTEPSTRYDADFLVNARAVTFAGWTNGPNPNRPSDARFLTAGEDVTVGANRLQISNLVSTPTVIQATVTDVDLGSIVVSHTEAGFPDGEWHHIALVVDGAAASTYPGLHLYFDGVLKSTVPFTGAMDFSLFTEIGIGRDFGSSFAGVWEGNIDDVVVLPYAASAEQIAGLAGIGELLPDFPRLLMKGDLLAGKGQRTSPVYTAVPADRAIVEAELGNSSLVGTRLQRGDSYGLSPAPSSNFDQTNRIVRFTLREV